MIYPRKQQTKARNRIALKQNPMFGDKNGDFAQWATNFIAFLGVFGDDFQGNFDFAKSSGDQNLRGEAATLGSLQFLN